VAAGGFTGALLVDPRVRACAATGARRRRRNGPRSHTTTNTAAAAAAASTFKTRRRTLWRALRRTWRRTWPSGPGRRVPSSRRHHCRRCRLCAARAEMGAQLGSSVAFAVLGANWAAQWHLARAVGRRFRGCRAKCLNVHVEGWPRAMGCTEWVPLFWIFFFGAVAGAQSPDLGPKVPCNQRRVAEV